MISDILEVEPVDCEQNEDYLFECKGCIDIRANPVLEVLREVPPNSRVLLNFKHVERVNSMGLSLLLKIFQEWKKSETHVEVYNLNRMVGMLFKITGLGSYVKSGELANVVKTTVDPTQRQTAEPKAESKSMEPPQSAMANTHHGTTVTTSTISGSRPGSTLRFAANITNSFHRSGWFALTTFMQRQLKTAIHFEQCTDISQIRGKQVDLFFGNPFFAYSLIQTKKLVPIMRTRRNAEQVVILSHSDTMRPIGHFNGARVTAASPDSLVFLLGRKMLDDNGLNTSDLTYSYSGNEIKAIQNLVRERADLAFVLKQTYEGLSSFSRNSVNLLLNSNVSFSHPLFCIAPKLNGMKDEIVEVLSNMDQNDAGRNILKKIQLEGWDSSKSMEIEKLRKLFHHYGNHGKSLI